MRMKLERRSRVSKRLITTSCLFGQIGINLLQLAHRNRRSVGCIVLSQVTVSAGAQSGSERE